MGTFILDDFPQRLSQSVGPRALTGFAVLTGYLLFIRKLRYLRRDRKHAEYPYRTREDFSRMTADHAQEIVRYCMALEFPYLSEKALSFALFKYSSLGLAAACTHADADAGPTVYRPYRSCYVRPSNC
jgi:hypothetical protein